LQEGRVIRWGVSIWYIGYAGGKALKEGIDKVRVLMDKAGRRKVGVPGLRVVRGEGSTPPGPEGTLELRELRYRNRSIGAFRRDWR
jgi:hypothetical protein